MMARATTVENDDVAGKTTVAIIVGNDDSCGHSHL